MPQQFINNWRSELSTAALAGDGTLDIPTADGDLLGTVTASDFYLLTLEDGSKREIVKVTGYSGGTLTVTRAQEGTTAQDWPLGSLIEARLTAGSMAALQGTPAPATVYLDSIAANDILTLDASVAETFVMRGGAIAQYDDVTIQPVAPDASHWYGVRLVNELDKAINLLWDPQGGLMLYADPNEAGYVINQIPYRGILYLETTDGGSRWRARVRGYDEEF